MKDMLIIRASEDVAMAELMNIASQLSLYGVKYVLKEIDSFEKLYSVLHEGGQYDYIYLATHGCETSFGNISGTVNITWTTFGATVCSSGIAKPGAVFMHSCCRGGLKEVAWRMFGCCNQIDYVCGPRHNVSPVDLITSFNLFLYFIETRNIDPIQSAKKVLSATDIRLVCYDRIEDATGTEYASYCSQISPEIQHSFSQLDRYEFSLMLANGKSVDLTAENHGSVPPSI